MTTILHQEDKLPAVDICLATYNGAPFLEAQLASLWAQRDQDFRILARDDGSSDGTQAILAAQAKAFPGRFVIVTSPSNGGGARGNFAALLAATTAPYIACCDQDDVWETDHLVVLRGAMAELEVRNGRNVPLLVHSDLRVVDADLHQINPSLWNFQHLDPSRTRLAPLLLQNVVTGCAMLANRACVQCSLPIPSECMMHDWWMTLVCAAFGALAATPEATVLYRQHRGNALGAQRRIDLHAYWCRLREGELGEAGFRASYRPNLAQGRAFFARFSGKLSSEAAGTVTAFTALETASWWRRRWLVVRYGFWRIGALRNLVWWLRV
jgi:glycosyltransferase involved in cell wall biosynthesis